MHFDGPKRLPSEQKNVYMHNCRLSGFLTDKAKNGEREREIGAKTVVVRNAGSRR